MREAQILAGERLGQLFGRTPVGQGDQRFAAGDRHQGVAGHRIDGGQPLARFHPVVHRRQRHADEGVLLRAGGGGVLALPRLVDLGADRRDGAVQQFVGGTASLDLHRLVFARPVEPVTGDVDRHAARRIGSVGRKIGAGDDHSAGLIGLGDAGERVGIAGDGILAADRLGIGQFAVRHHQRHQRGGGLPCLPGGAPGGADGAPVGQRHRQDDEGPRRRFHILGGAAALAERIAHRIGPEPHGDGADIAAGRHLLLVYLETLDQLGDLAVRQARRVAAAGNEPAVQLGPGLGLRLADRLIAHGGRIAAVDVDPDAGHREGVCSGRSGGSGGGGGDGGRRRGTGLRPGRPGHRNDQSGGHGSKTGEERRAAAVEHCKAFRFEYVRPEPKARYIAQPKRGYHQHPVL
ncbi:hypothetical protein Lal_00005327 [Lupinus albus]|nr:hypothetical protein Lal_00005327 [Lupinus albus]